MIFNMTGGGASLNFQVKTYPSETELKADNPKENTIGVITNTTMTSWVFSATEPTKPEVGMVWIAVGTSSTADFNALKKNTLQVYPLSAKQYEGNKFVSRVAMLYQVGEWIKWTLYLYDSGKEFEDITGGWSANGWQKWSDNAYEDVVGPVKNADHMQFDNNGTVVAAGTANKINLTGYSTLYVEAIVDDSVYWEGSYFSVSISLYTNKVVDKDEIASLSLGKTTTGKNKYSLSLDNVSGEAYIAVFTANNEDAAARIYKIWLEA